jgi:predicted NAD/FAD-dependent oxidoreductase
MRPEVERMVPAIAGRIARARVYRFDRGTVVPRPGFVKDHARGRELANALPLPITLAGDYLATPIIEGAVASGLRAADALMSRLT